MLKKILLLNLIYFFILTNCFGAVVEGTNAGFVTSAPVDDPAATVFTFDALASACKFTSPAGTNSVTSMGWWCDTASEAADFDIGIYSHDAGNDRPNVIVASTVDQAKGTDTGWKTASVAYDLTASTVYWLGAQLDDTATATSSDNTINAAYKRDWKTFQTALPATWGVSTGTIGRIQAIYALYSAGGAARRIIFIQ